jgi:hypothetical protein
MAPPNNGARQWVVLTVRHAAALALVAVATGQLTACSVDARTLEAAPGMAGAGTSGGGTSSSGGGPSLDMPVPLCVFDGEPLDDECETLVENPGFESDARGWQPEHDKVATTWDERDPTNNDASGSLKVINTLRGKDTGITADGAGQCLQVDPGTLVQFAADFFIPEGQGLGLDGEQFVGHAALTVLFYERADCVSPSVGSIATPLDDTVGSWQHLEQQTLVPADVGSMSLRLAAVKNHRQYTLEVLFDNVLLKAIQ